MNLLAPPSSCEKTASASSEEKVDGLVLKSRMGAATTKGMSTKGEG